MDAITETKLNILNKILYIVKLSSVFFCVLAYFQYWFMNTGNEPNLTIRTELIFLFIVLLGLGLYLLFLSLWKKHYSHLFVEWFQPLITMVISFVTILLTGTYHSNFKYLFIFVIISSTIECGMKTGLIYAGLSSALLLITDLVLVTHVDVNIYFQNDLILVCCFLIIAWTIGYYVKTEQNYSQLKAYEQILREKNDALEKSMAMKDEFLSLISHELRTPLTTIHAAVNLMELYAKNGNSAKAMDFIKNIKKNTFRQIKLVNNILDVTRANAEKIKLSIVDKDIVALTFSIVESIDEYLKLRNLKLFFTTNISSYQFSIDEEKYERIMLNLLSNAIKFSPPNKNIYVSIQVDQDFVKVIVADEGIGIPDDKISMIFEHFGQVDSSFTRQAEGSGIGLCLVKKFVEFMKGKITVASKVGEGSTFTVWYPNQHMVEDDPRNHVYEITENRLLQEVAIEFSDIN